MQVVYASIYSLLSCRANKNIIKFSILKFFFITLLFSNCSIFYHKLQKFNNSFERYEFNKADNYLTNKRVINPNGKDKLLFYLNKGIVLHMMKEYEESNRYFEVAFEISSNAKANIAKNILSYFLNPNIVDYAGEEHEILLINYYKALNYIKLNDIDGALQECRRMDFTLRNLRQKNTSKKSYRRDAMLYTLMGIMFQANGEYNHAFYAYKNAVDAYKEDYKDLFDIVVPNQLKLDLLHTAYMMQFSEFDYYEQLFNMKYNHEKYIQDCNLICIWHNGLGPYKDSIDLNFIVNPSVGGIIYFRNDEYGLDFPFPLPKISNEEFDIAKTMIFRICFPKYIERKPLFDKAEIYIKNQRYEFELLNDINKISFQVLKQRMIWELGQTLLRIFLKKLAENRLNKVHGALGFALGIFNTVVESADTRNWQSVPHSIYYNRIKVPLGQNSIIFRAFSSQKMKEKSEVLHLNVQKHKTRFLIFNTLESRK